MKRTTCLLWLLPALALAAGRDDYAREWPLTLHDAGAGAYRATLDRDVYRSAASPALRDVAVFNGDGRPVPAALFDPARPLAQAGRQVVLAWFPLPAGDASPGQDLAVISERDADGRVRRIETRMADAAPSVRAANAWLIDASGIREPIAALVLEWPRDSAAIDVTYRVEGSDDLRHWRTLQPHAQLLDLVRGGQRLRQQRIALGARAKYLRLSPLRSAAALPLSGVRAELAATPVADDWHWESLQGRAVEESGQVNYDFVVHGRFPFARADIGSDGNDGNDANEWTLHSRDDAGAPWVARAGPWVAFRLGTQAGGGRSAPQAFAGVVRDRHWRLSSRSPAADAPTLALGYRPEVVMFLAQGAPPYALVAGSARAVRADAPLPQLVDAIRVQRGRNWQPAPATLGPARTLAGERALAPARDWTSWLLWSLLVAGALAVAGFAISLLRGRRGESGTV